MTDAEKLLLDIVLYCYHREYRGSLNGKEIWHYWVIEHEALDFIQKFEKKIRDEYSNKNTSETSV